MTEQSTQLYEMANKEIGIWVDPSGAICLKVKNNFGDPVELAEHEAIALGELLIRLAQEQRNS